MSHLGALAVLGLRTHVHPHAQLGTAAVKSRYITRTLLLDLESSMPTRVATHEYECSRRRKKSEEWMHYMPVSSAAQNAPRHQNLNRCPMADLGAPESVESNVTNGSPNANDVHRLADGATVTAVYHFREEISKLQVNQCCGAQVLMAPMRDRKASCLV